MNSARASLASADGFWTTWRRLRWRGFHRTWTALHRAGDKVSVTTRYGSIFALDPLAYIDGLVIEEGFYESEVLAELLPALQPRGAVLWDIGANFGLHAVTAARLARDATVVAFEPNPGEHARLLLHRQWNAPHLITSSLALSDAEGVLPLHLGPPGNSGLSALAPWFHDRSSGTVLVAVARGDDLIARGTLPAPTAIKLDVEGQEAAVLRGLTHALASAACRLVVFEDEPRADSAAKRLLQSAGFAIRPLQRQERSQHSLVNFAAHKAPATAPYPHSG